MYWVHNSLSPFADELLMDQVYKTSEKANDLELACVFTDSIINLTDFLVARDSVSVALEERPATRQSGPGFEIL